MRLLLDAYIAVAVEAGLREVGIDAVAVNEWMGGEYRTASDEEVLRVAFQDERVLVTFDLRTVPPLLKRWAETGVSHAGVILIDQKTIRPGNVGGLIRPLQLISARDDIPWRDRVIFLRGT